MKKNVRNNPPRANNKHTISSLSKMNKKTDQKKINGIQFARLGEHHFLNAQRLEAATSLGKNLGNLQFRRVVFNTTRTSSPSIIMPQSFDQSDSGSWIRTAVESNLRLGTRMGWISRVDEIIDHLQNLGFLPGLQSPDDRKFAIAVKEYQDKHPQLIKDGIIGQNTWRFLRQELDGVKNERKETVSTNDRTDRGFGRAVNQIRIRGLRGLERIMAGIHNKYGDYLEQKSSELGIDVADAAAFLKVESGGQGFSPQTGRIKIRFENHHFFRHWGHYNREVYMQHFKFNNTKHWRDHKFRPNSNDKFEDVHSSQSREWEVLEFASSLDNEAALKSISMGNAQILGSNYALIGYSSVQEMFDDMSDSLQAQTEGLFEFIVRKRGGIIVRALQDKNYTLAARYYNGKGKQALYGQRIRSASQAYSRIKESSTR